MSLPRVSNWKKTSLLINFYRLTSDKTELTTAKALVRFSPTGGPPLSNKTGEDWEGAHP